MSELKFACLLTNPVFGADSVVVQDAQGRLWLCACLGTQLSRPRPYHGHAASLTPVSAIRQILLARHLA